jgi:hypothetical protein
MIFQNHPNEFFQSSQCVFSCPPQALFFAVKEPVKIFGEGAQRKLKRV